MMVGSPRTSTVMQHGWSVKFEDRVWLDHQETGTVMQHGWTVNLKTEYSKKHEISLRTSLNQCSLQMR